MVGNRSRDTSPELLVRSAVHSAGLRYRVAARPSKTVRRSADLVFRPQRVAVFIDGCFWHGCPDHFVLPKTNTDYWRAKIDGNQRRDAETDGLLAGEGWRILRFWEHDDPVDVADQIVTVVRRLKEAQPSHGVASIVSAGGPDGSPRP